MINLLTQSFNTPAARRRLENIDRLSRLPIKVSTHQPPEGGWLSSCAHRHRRIQVSTHQPPEGGWRVITSFVAASFEFQHTSRPKAAGKSVLPFDRVRLFQHTSRPKAAGPPKRTTEFIFAFQHTSRPKAAGPLPSAKIQTETVSTHQPPEGGWKTTNKYI